MHRDSTDWLSGGVKRVWAVQLRLTDMRSKLLTAPSTNVQSRRFGAGGFPLNITARILLLMPSVCKCNLRPLIFI
jgi:hypothetical protein